MKMYLYLFAFVFLFACGTSDNVVKYSDKGVTKSSDCNLDIFSQNLATHKKTEVIGEISVQDTGFSLNCDSDTVIKKIKSKACQAGADAIHLYDIKHPHWSKSTCFQAKARFLIYK